MSGDSPCLSVSQPRKRKVFNISPSPDQGLKGERTISRVLFRPVLRNARDPGSRSSIYDRRYRLPPASTSGKDGQPCIPDLTCTGRGLLARTCRQAAGELLPHLHTLTRASARAVWFLCTFHRLAPPGYYPASCPAVLGLSSDVRPSKISGPTTAIASPAPQTLLVYASALLFQGRPTQPVGFLVLLTAHMFHFPFLEPRQNL